MQHRNQLRPGEPLERAHSINPIITRELGSLLCVIERQVNIMTRASRLHTLYIQYMYKYTTSSEQFSEYRERENES